jgi:hypothetical protein
MGCESFSKMKQVIQMCGQEVRVTGRLLRIGRPEADGYQSLTNPEAMIQALKESGAGVDLFTFLELRPAVSRKHPYFQEQDNAAVIPVSTFDNWWNKQIKPEARNRARQAEKKGVVIREVPFDENLVQGIWQIYNESRMRQGRLFPHYGEDLKTVYEESATFLDSSVFIGAFLGDRLIGFLKLTMDQTGTRANLMNILSLIEHRDKSPTNALIAHAVRACEARAINQLVYQRFVYGNKQSDGIMKFKQVNGFQRVDLPRYYVAITPFGWLGLRLGLHHRLVEHLPAPVAEKLRQLRTSWYDRRLQHVKEPA